LTSGNGNFRKIAALSEGDILERRRCIFSAFKFCIQSVERLNWEAGMPEKIVIAAAATADLERAPVRLDWVLNGAPETRSKELARSHDRTSCVMVWDCTAGHFNWHYNKDETLVVISGEAFITNENGEERRLGPGDIVFFPAGTSSTWRVPRYIKKVAFLRHTMPRSLGFGVLAWNLLLRIMGARGFPQRVPSAGMRRLDVASPDRGPGRGGG
jgi:uncharacterized protein